MLFAKVELDTNRLDFSKDRRTRVAFLDLAAVPVLGVAGDDLLEEPLLVELFDIGLGLVQAQNRGLILCHELC